MSDPTGTAVFPALDDASSSPIFFSGCLLLGMMYFFLAGSLDGLTEPL
jgi:hypothetical protein